RGAARAAGRDHRLSGGPADAGGADGRARAANSGAGARAADSAGDDDGQLPGRSCLPGPLPAVDERAVGAEGRGHGAAAGEARSDPVVQARRVRACVSLLRDGYAEAINDEACALVAVVEGGAVAARVLAGAAFAQHLDLADSHEPAELVHFK